MNTLAKLICIAILVLASYNSNAQVSSAKEVNITNFTAAAKANKLFINWSTDGAIQTNYFEVQRSEDGNTFKTVGMVMGPDPRQSGDSYVFAETEKTVSNKPVYFRLCHIDTNGGVQVSKMIQL